MLKVKNLPVFMQDCKTSEILKLASAVIPKNTRAYIVGGAVRNAIYFELFHKRLPQRDYDLLVIGDGKQFVKNLRFVGFTYGLIRRKYDITLKKKKIDNPKNQFKDYVILDIHFSEEKSVRKNLKKVSGFTINAFALPLQAVNSKDWRKKIICLSESINDLKKKKLRINVISHPAMLFACIRLMSKGFKKPQKEDVKRLLKALGKLEKWRYKRNIKKVFDYVSGEEKAKKIAKNLGIKENIFDFDIIKKLK